MLYEPAARLIAKGSTMTHHQTCMTIQGENDAVREGLRQLMSLDSLQTLSEECRGTLEIVLAEVLNNVVEHAYRDGPGPIRICFDHLDTVLRVSIHDQGLPMPDLQLPKGELKPATFDDPPEGGFGWFLIRSLAADLAYDREGDFNHLYFEVLA
jgi:serine/threonine-protein kinase RsbW